MTFTDAPALRMAWLNLWRNKLRTALAMLGIVIGVVAIAGIGITGTALQYGATQELGDLSNTVTVSPGEDSDGVITDAQVSQIERVATGATVVPQRSERLEVSSRSEAGRVGVEATTRPAALYSAAEGTIPSPMRNGVLLGEEMAAELGVELGQTVSVDGRSYRVLAIIEPASGFGPGGVSVVVPLDAVDRDGYDTVTVVAEDGEHAQQLAEEIPAEVNRREEVVDTFAPADIQESVSGFFATLNAALLGVGSISLVVAGVSILNVMLMSVVERRAEIGVFRAVGIRRREVMRMIVAEAALLGVVGGVVGVALSVVIGLAVNGQLNGDPTLVVRRRNLEFLALGFGFAVAASTLSGVYPAWKASNENPVEVLRG